MISTWLIWPKNHWSCRKVCISFGLWFKRTKSHYREGLGATLINDDFDVSKPYLVPKRTKLNNTLFSVEIMNLKTHFLATLIIPIECGCRQCFDAKENWKENAFPLVIYTKSLPKSMILVSIKNSRILGWSMTKSITSAMFEFWRNKGKFDIDAPAHSRMGKWTKKLITTNDDLLHMNLV
jgi:hypothetical protein